jgi:hypothetical protein
MGLSGGEGWAAIRADLARSLGWLAWPLLVLGIVVGVGLLWVLWAMYGVQWIAKAVAGRDGLDLTALGQTGDLFGGVNAMFAAFAFAGVAVAAHYQHRTWKLQRYQLEMAKREHERAAFEPLFFELLRRAVRPSLLLIVAGKGMVPQRGYTDEVEFDEAMRQAAELVQANALPDHPLNRGEIELLYLALYHRNESRLGPYLRTLYHVFKLIARSPLSKEEKVSYANMARASLGTPEVFLLALNCLTDYGAEFREYVEGFGLLKHRTLKDPRNNNASADDRVAKQFYARSAVMSEEQREAHWSMYPKERASFLLE